MSGVDELGSQLLLLHCEPVYVTIAMDVESGDVIISASRNS